MVFIAAFFPLVLMIAKTTRLVEAQLLEAAQVLGASRKQLITRVVFPNALPNIYNDLRILLAMAWTILIIAELTGVKSGISGYIDVKKKYYMFDYVYAALIMIGLLGLFIDRLLAWLHPFLFPWQGQNGESNVASNHGRSNCIAARHGMGRSHPACESPTARSTR